MMKAVKSIYGKHEEIVVLFEFERVADVLCAMALLWQEM